MKNQITRLVLVAIFAIVLLTSTAFAEEMATVSISGILKDYNGKPVKEGFVMLKGNPRLNAITDGLGLFKISGQACSLPDTLLASWAGCEMAEVKITKAETKGLDIKLKAEDREFTKIDVVNRLLFDMNL